MIVLPGLSVLDIQITPPDVKKEKTLSNKPDHPFALALNHIASLNQNIYLQGCKHTLCLGGICLGNWEKWRCLLLVLSPTFHIDQQASLQSCSSLKIHTANRKEEEKKEVKDLCFEEEIFRDSRHTALVMGITWCILPCCSRQPKNEKTCNNCKNRMKNAFWLKTGKSTYFFPLFWAWFQVCGKVGVESAMTTFQVLINMYCTSATW